MKQLEIKKFASWLGKHKSERKAHAARENGKRGGRPRKEALFKVSQGKKYI